ncbi:arginine--tRNA ligase [Nocardia vinacea]|uniref:arginine--tRNA ligase domain-containing protein n=1 Tax=Nocardia vinacea TaxID=96468 RepID=UPI002E0D8650
MPLLDRVAGAVTAAIGRARRCWGRIRWCDVPSARTSSRMGRLRWRSGREAVVIRQNHLADWGTQFGMMIQYRG